MTKREYPRTVWVLQPSMKPVQVEIVKPAKSWGRFDDGDFSAKGKWYGLANMFETKADAIAAGRRGLSAQEVKLALMSEKVAKRRAALDKAEARDD